jgi:NitT/TauT family transport system substrate-binding protein
VKNRSRLWLAVGAVAALAAAVVLILWATGVLWPGDTEPELEQVTAIMAFIPNSEWMGFYTAINQGYYADEGLEVEMTYTTEGGFGAVKQVVAGQAVFGYAAGESVILARSQGIPIVAVYQPDRNCQFNLITLQSSGYAGPGDLEGKTVAITGAGGPVDIGARAMLTAAGVDLDTVSFVPVGSGLIPALTEGEADAIAALIFHEVLLDSMDVDYNVWYARDYVGNYGISSIVATEETIRNDPDLVERFVRASHRGWQYAMDHPVKMVDMYIEEFNPEAQDFRDVELEFWERLVEEQFLRGVPGLGKIVPELWKTGMQVLLDMGAIETPIDLSEAYRTQFAP